jgi:hypothetical protein
VTFTTCDGASYDTAIQVFSGSCGALSSLGCNDDTGGACGLRSTLTVPVVGAQRLYVRVGGFNGLTGTFMLRVSETQANDECTGAITVFNGVNGVYRNRDATTSAPGWPCGAGGSDVWFLYTATFTGNLLANVCTAARTYDTTLQIFSGPCGAPVSLGCNDDSCGLGSSLTVPVTNGTAYLIRVGGFGGGQGEFELVLGGTVANDHCINAIAVNHGVNGPFTNVNSTTSTPTWPCGLGGNDVWFRYTATCTCPHTFTTCTPTRTYDTTIQVFEGGCGGLSALGCNDDAGGACGLGSRLTVPLVSGQTYHVRVGGFSSATGSFDLTVEQGTGTGSIVITPPACGPATISVTGAPHIGGSVTTTIGGTGPGLPLIGYGFFPGSGAFCGCNIGHNWLLSIVGTVHTLGIPCDPALIGVLLGIQGAGLGTPGGCPNPMVSITNLATVTIG